ncbi:MAG TPA: hypothetical protein VGM81_11755 [Burkholderiaceae bacterium]|jgi:hypothetical protein
MAPQDVQNPAATLDGGSRYLGREATHPDHPDRHEQWRVEQMSAYGEVYSSWRDNYCRKHLWAAEPQDAALSYMKTLFAA